jgi:hypothetical protein
MGAVTTTPNGTAIGNSDAVRQSVFSNFFFAAPNLLSGVDAEPRVSTATDGATMLGYGSTLGVDIGVGVNGDVYIRGQAGTGTGNVDQGTTGQPVASQAKLSPLMLLLIVGAVVFLAQK